MTNKGQQTLLAILLLVVMMVISTPQYFYQKGLRGLPENREPITHPAIPTIVSQTYWTFLGGTDAPSISPKNPYGLIFEFVMLISASTTSGFQNAENMLLSRAARSLVFRDRSFDNWLLANFSAAIWISRNWTVDETISTLLLSTYFGNELYGIDTAAMEYLGLSLPELTKAQIIYLLVITRAPSRDNPWCHPERHRKSFETASERMNFSGEYASITLLPVPSGMCR